MNNFLKKNKKRKIVVLDIPLLIENNLNKNNDILIFVKAKKKEITTRLKKRKNFNKDLYVKFKKIQYSNNFKRRKSNFILTNDFKKKTVKTEIKKILNEII